MPWHEIEVLMDLSPDNVFSIKKLRSYSTSNGWPGLFCTGPLYRCMLAVILFDITHFHESRL